MQKFTTLEGVAAPLRMINVDTDMVIPKQYLKTIKRTGLGKGLFSELRYKDDGSENPDFVLNKPAYRNAKIYDAQQRALTGRPDARRHRRLVPAGHERRRLHHRHARHAVAQSEALRHLPRLALRSNGSRHGFIRTAGDGSPLHCRAVR